MEHTGLNKKKNDVGIRCRWSEAEKTQVREMNGKTLEGGKEEEEDAEQV